VSETSGWSWNVKVRSRTSWIHYLGWAAVSQGANAGTNILLLLLLARSLPTRDFGTVAVGLAFVPLVVAGLRGLAFEPAVVHGDLSSETANQVVHDTVVAGAGAGLCLLVTVFVSRGPMVLAGVLALGALATVVEEGIRWILFGMDRPRAGAMLDVIWGVLQVGVVALSVRSPTVAAMAWTAGAVVSAGVGWIGVSRNTEKRHSRPTVRVWQWGFEYVIAAGSLQLAVLVVPITGGVEVAGGLRGAMSILGAASVVLGGTQQAVAGRLHSIKNLESLRRWGLRIAFGLGVLVALVSAPMLAINDSIGHQLLGPTWPAARAVLPILILQKVATAAACGPAFVLRKLADHTAGVWWRAALTFVTLIAVLIGAGFGSEVGAAWVLALSAVASVPIWLRLLMKATGGTQSPSERCSLRAERADVVQG
jgi:O-antigen/teichoic acid export membrane protein